MCAQSSQSAICGGGRLVEQATPGEEFVGSIPTVAAHYPTVWVMFQYNVAG